MNQNLLSQQDSINVALANRIRQLQADGQTICQLQTGDPDFDTPAFIIQAACYAMQHGDTHYCASSGKQQLKQAICTKLMKDNAINVQPSEVLVTQGAVHGLYLALQGILNRADEVIVIAPYWMPYYANIVLAGAKPVVLETHLVDDYAIDINQLQRLITKRTKAIIINSPNNPTGKILNRAELTRIGDLAVANNLYIIADEVYEQLVFQGQHFSIQALYPDYPNIISLFSFSKSFAMTGWRIGYLVANTDVVNQLNKLTQYISTSVSPFIQAGAHAALVHEQSASVRQQMLTIYQQRLTHIIEQLDDSWARQQYYLPQGTFYLFINVSDKTASARQLVEHLLMEQQCAFTPGVAFGAGYDQYIRMTFASSLADINTGLSVLRGL